jgi:hypothetical protein
MTREEVRQQAEALAVKRGVTRVEAEAWAVDAYLKHLVAQGRMALVGRVSTPLQTAKVFGGHKTELDALGAALEHAAKITAP